VILDLGCGDAKEPGAIGVDNVSLPGVDCVHDLRDAPYPFDDTSAEKIFLKHVVEHFTLVEQNILLDECYRLLQPGGMLIIRVPHINSVAAWIDPTHQAYFTFETILFFIRGTQKAYYKQTNNQWDLRATSCQVTWLNWKSYRLRQIDRFLSQILSSLINWLLSKENFPGSADLAVKWVPMFFVEIEWQLTKPFDAELHAHRPG
jgi:SAM-dependent methyltransferase